MAKINDSQSVSSLRDQQIGLETDPSVADSSAVSGHSFQLEFDLFTNRGTLSPEAIQATSGKDNKQVIECYYRSKPKINVYRQRMHAIQRDKDMFNMTEQRLIDQQSQIRKKQQLMNLQLEEIRGRIEDEPYGHVPKDSEREDEQWFLGFDKKGGDLFLKDVRVVVEDIGNQHENVEFGFKIKDELLEDEKKMLKNM